MRTARTPRVIVAATFVFATGCSSDRSLLPTIETPGKGGAAYTSIAEIPTNVAITPSPVPNLNLGATVVLSGRVTSSTGQTLARIITWTSSNSAVASVNSQGVVSALVPGSSVIRGTVTNWATGTPVTGLATVTVQSATATPVKSISVVLGSTNMTIATTSQATAIVKDSLGQVLVNRPVTWMSLSPTVATVNAATGVVTAVAAGASTITATNGLVTGSANVTVSPAAVASVKSITVGLSTTSIAAAASAQASATLKDSLGRVLTGRTVTWSSASASVATINAATGFVTGVAAGTSTITATSGSVTGSASITVTAAAPPSPLTNAILAILPQVYLNTTAPAAPAAGGTTISVAAGGNLQAALNSAQPGDVIELANGATFSGNFTLPNKNTTSTNWIVIRPASMAGVPAEGSRMTPSLAATARLPIILSTTNQGAFSTDIGAHHYRLIALEVSVPASIPNTGLIRLGSGYESSVAQLPHDLVLDRLYVHGAPTGENRRCVTLNSASSAVIDSYISDCHEHSSDSQAIAAWNGSGPFKIVNNYLEAASENIMFGGADPMIPGMVASDIEIRHNHITKQLGWKGQGWVVKNLFELKAAHRVLVEGNLFENNWQDAQGGSAISLKSVNQGGTCAPCGTADVTFRLNLIRNTGSGFALTGLDPGASAIMSRVTITDNVMSGINVAPWFDGDGRGFLINNNPIDLVVAHNTVPDPTNTAITFGGPTTMPPLRLVLRDNIVGGGQYGVKGPGLGIAASFAAFMPTGGYLGNVITLQAAAGYPAGNFFASSLAAVGFTNAGAGDFHLTSGSAYWGKGTDMINPGADIDAMNTAITGVIVP